MSSSVLPSSTNQLEVELTQTPNIVNSSPGIFFSSLSSTMANIGLLDVIVLGGVALTAYYFFVRRFNQQEKQVTPQVKRLNINTSLAERSKGFINRMKHGNRSIVVFFGSQTGTAEEFASRLVRESKRYALKAVVADPEDCDMEDLTKLRDIPNSLAVFLMATYGEGDPTDNAQEFYNWLQEGVVDLTGIKYCVFGLGNKTYEHYNAVGIYVDQRLEELGAERVIKLGLGDDDINIEEDFLVWKEEFWPTVCDYFGVHETGEDFLSRQYTLVTHENLPEEKVFSSEPLKLGSYKKQKPPYDMKNPFLSRVMSKRNLHKGGSRSFWNIQFSLENSRIRYDSGDHVGIFPHNKMETVEWLGVRLGCKNLDQQISLVNTDEEAPKKHPFPCPTTYRVALSHYLDLSSLPRTNVIKDISEHCSNPEDKQFLLSLIKTTPESKLLYTSFIISEHRTLIHLLQDFPSLQPPLDLVCELLPRLQCRYYSISSSPKKDPLSLSITAVLVEFKTKTNRDMEGVCTGLLNLIPLSLPKDNEIKMPLFIRKSQFRLPGKTLLPILMVGPGTGLAPFMSFLEEREVLKSSGKVLGPAYLYYGCRKKSEDYLYEKELKRFLEIGVLTSLYVAFSRDQEKKVYVQHLMDENSEEIHSCIQQKGHFYVCGDARNMAQDVDKVMHRILMEKGGLDKNGADDLLKRMRKNGRYSCDVWS